MSAAWAVDDSPDRQVPFRACFGVGPLSDELGLDVVEVFGLRERRGSGCVERCETGDGVLIVEPGRLRRDACRRQPPKTMQEDGWRKGWLD